MTIRISRTVTSLLAAVTFAAALTALSSDAQARGGFGWGGFGLGFAAGMIGTAAMTSAYDGPVYRCRYVKTFDRFGNYLGSVQRCW